MGHSTLRRRRPPGSPSPLGQQGPYGTRQLYVATGASGTEKYRLNRLAGRANGTSAVPAERRRRRFFGQYVGAQALHVGMAPRLLVHAIPLPQSHADWPTSTRLPTKSKPNSNEWPTGAQPSNATRQCPVATRRHLLRRRPIETQSSDSEESRYNVATAHTTLPSRARR